MVPTPRPFVACTEYILYRHRPGVRQEHDEDFQDVSTSHSTRLRQPSAKGWMKRFGVAFVLGDGEWMVVAHTRPPEDPLAAGAAESN